MYLKKERDEYRCVITTYKSTTVETIAIRVVGGCDEQDDGDAIYDRAAKVIHDGAPTLHLREPNNESFLRSPRKTPLVPSPFSPLLWVLAKTFSLGAELSLRRLIDVIENRPLPIFTSPPAPPLSRTVSGDAYPYPLIEL